jgi:cell division protein FtsA
MPRHNDEYLVGVDLGTATTRCAIACWRSDGELELEGYGEAPTRGVTRGLIVDAASAAEGVGQAVEAAALRARVRVGSLFASVATPYARGLNSRGCIGIPHEDKVARGGDALRALEAANRVSLPSDRAVTEVYSQGFALDDVRGILNPVGLAGGRLEAEVQVVTDLASAHGSIAQVVRKAGYDLEQVVFGPLAAAEAVLTEEEKRLGSVHVDIGAAKTSVVIYAGGYPRFLRVLPLGGQQITNDLAIGLNTSVEDAEELKREWGIADSRRPRRKESVPKVDVVLADGTGVHTVPLWRVGVIVRARVEEVFELVEKELTRSGLGIAACARVTLTGGFCCMAGALEAAHRALRRPVRFGRVELPTTRGQFESDPTHAVALGTLVRGVSLRERKFDRRFEESGFRTALKRVAGWL